MIYKLSPVERVAQNWRKTGAVLCFGATLRQSYRVKRLYKELVSKVAQIETGASSAPALHHYTDSVVVIMQQ
jgi:hypothetical protein